jgi:hypothetical protein
MSMVDEVWYPAAGPKPVMLRWLMSEWCNYRCPYCPQTHDRHAPKGDGFTAHCFDNHPIETWLEAFERHFGRSLLSLVMTGGETMLDRKNMTRLINHLTAQSWVAAIRVDTNAWWRPDQFAGLDLSKLILMCTYHPSQTTEERFIRNLLLYREAGIEIGVINYVMDAANTVHFERLRARFADLGLVLTPNPLWTGTGDYSPEASTLLQTYLPPLDYEWRAGGSPFGKSCRFPGLSYEMDLKGNVFPGCHPEKSGSLFDATLAPVEPQYSPCPTQGCVCLDKYSFLEGVERNVTLVPLRHYAAALSERAAAVAASRT